MSEYVSTKNRFNVSTIAKISVLGALSCLLMLFEIPLPFAPSFLELDFSEVVVLIGGFALGPWAAVCIEALKIVLNLLMNGSSTMGVGELSNFLIGCALVVPAVCIYQRQKTKRHAIWGLVAGTLIMTVIGALINYFLIIPAYAFFMQPALSMEVIISMGTVINPNIDGLFTLILWSVIPFNIVKGIAVSTIVFISYKKVAPLLKR